VLYTAYVEEVLTLPSPTCSAMCPATCDCFLPLSAVAMPRKKPAVPLRRRYSLDLRLRVIHQHHTLKRKTWRITRDLDISLRVVQRILKMWNDLGELVPPEKHGRTPEMKEEQIEVRYSTSCACACLNLDQFLLVCIERNPAITLDEMQAELDSMFDLQVHTTTISRTLNGLGIRNKRVRAPLRVHPSHITNFLGTSLQLSKAAAERCEEARNEFRFRAGAYPSDFFVWVDESAVDLRTTYRLNGWAYKGRRARIRAVFRRGKRCVSSVCQQSCLFVYGTYSILPALTSEGIIYSDIKIGSWDGEHFLEFLDGLLEHMNPFPAPRSVLVMDNCSVHHVPDVLERCRAR
jgi:transposase